MCLLSLSSIFLTSPQILRVLPPQSPQTAQEPLVQAFILQSSSSSELPAASDPASKTKLPPTQGQMGASQLHHGIPEQEPWEALYPPVPRQE